MSTRPVWTKAGLRLEVEVEKKPLPRLAQVWPIPAFGSSAAALIQVATEVDANTGKTNLRVTTTDPLGLPPGNDQTWSLEHTAYVGAAPSTFTWDAVEVVAGPLSYLLKAPLPGATHKFRLVLFPPLGVRKPRSVYPEISISVPASAEAIRQDQLLSPNTDNLVPNPNAEKGALPGIDGALVVNDPTNAYEGNYVRKVDASATGTTPVTNRIPCIPGDEFRLEGFLKVSSGSAAISLKLTPYDASGAALTPSSTATVNATSYATNRSGVSYIMPSGAVSVEAGVVVNTAAGGAFGYVDGLEMRRVVTQAMQTTGSQTFSTPGAATFTVPPGVTRVKVTATGGGGGGGGGTTTAGGGGGGGASTVVTYWLVAPGDQFSITVGSKGSGGAAGAAGGNGTATTVFTSVGSLQVANAGGGSLGSGGATSAGGAGANSPASRNRTGAAGPFNGGAANSTGTSTGAEMVQVGPSYLYCGSGGGGGGTGASSAGNSGSAYGELKSNATGTGGGVRGGGGGGVAYWGPGVAGGAGNTATPASGTSATTPGGGGGGGGGGNGTGTSSGGNGGDGVVVIEWGPGI